MAVVTSLAKVTLADKHAIHEIQLPHTIMRYSYFTELIRKKKHIFQYSTQYWSYV